MCFEVLVIWVLCKLVCCTLAKLWDLANHNTLCIYFFKNMIMSRCLRISELKYIAWFLICRPRQSHYSITAIYKKLYSLTPPLKMFNIMIYFTPAIAKIIVWYTPSPHGILNLPLELCTDTDALHHPMEFQIFPWDCLLTPLLVKMFII